MRHYERTPNVFLKRTHYYSDCTLGELTDENGNHICFTLEPPYRPAGERPVVGNTAIPEGVYPVKMEYDTTLRYKCPRVGDVRGFKNVRICFLTKAQAFAKQTKGHILVGMGINTDEGRLDDCVSAFEAILAYYEAKRCNHAQLCLQVTSDGFTSRQRQAFTQAPPEIEQALHDYELETL